MNRKIVIVCFFLATVSILSAQSGYKIKNKIHLDGDGSWDYMAVDEKTNRLFVSHSKIVQVVDTKEGKLIANIENTKGVHGITLAFDVNKGYTSNGKDSSVTVFDLTTLQTKYKVKVTGNKPDAILYDVFSHKVFVFNGKSNNATIIDANTDKVIETIKLDGKPEFSVTDEKGHVYVNIENRNEVVSINSTTLKVEKSWSVNPGEEPTGLAIDTKTHRLFSVCGNKLMIVSDYENGKIVEKVSIGEHCDGVVFDADKKIIYTSNGEGNISVISQVNANSYKAIDTIITQKGAKTIVQNKNTHQLFLPCSEYEEAEKSTSEGEEKKPKIKHDTFNVLVIE